MTPRALAPGGIGALAGALAGLLVGAADGLRAARLAGTGMATSAGPMLLSAALDAVAGLLAGGAAEVVIRAALWGRRSRARSWMRLLSWMVAGLGFAGAAVAVLIATVDWNNRFLAGGLVALAALGAALLGVFLAPALGRALDRRSSGGPHVAPTTGGILVAPLATAFLGALVLVVVSKARAPLGGAALRNVAIIVGAIALAGPTALAKALAIPFHPPARAALAAAVGMGGIGVTVFVSRFWETHLRFAPWSGLLAGAGFALVSSALAWSRALRNRWARLPGGLRLVACALGLVGSGLAAVVLGASEPSRKVVTARTGLAGPLLTLARDATDLDRDGHSRAFGGGDCDDGDRRIHPGEEDWPDDGIDQDCDGHDAKIVPLVSPPFAAVPDTVPRDLNILFVTIDTLRADHLGAYGYGRPTSPALDRLAAEGTVFENAWAHAPSTRYSMPAIATGRWPSAIEWDESIWWPRIGPGVRTLAEALASHGYFNGALYNFTYFALSDRRGFERGIDVYDDRRMALHVAVRGPVESRGSSSKEMADDAIAFLDAHKSRKFFLWVHFYDPHLAYERHADAPSFGNTRADLYDGEIAFTDKHVGRVLAHLRTLGLWDRTAVVMTGDHGEGLGEHGITEHGYHLYAPQTKVPIVVRVPGLPASRVATPVGHVDLAPTMVNLARGAPEPSFLGRSFVDLLAGRSRPSAEPVFQEVTYEGPVKRRGLASASHHLLWNWIPDGTTECYDLAADPTEKHDVWGRTPPVGACLDLAAALKEKVAALAFPQGFAEMVAFGVGKPGSLAPTPTHRLDARIGSLVEVRGWDGPLAAAPGTQIEIVTHLSAVRPIEDGWRVFFHLDGPEGFQNLDHVPVEGTYPVDRWRPGQWIRDRTRFTASRPGTYTLRIGLWRGPDRLPIETAEAQRVDRENRLRLATVTVK